MAEDKSGHPLQEVVAKVVPSQLPVDVMDNSLDAQSFANTSPPTVCISRTDYRIRTEMPDVRRLTLRANDIDFIVYQHGRDFTTGSQGEAELPEQMTRAMSYISGLDLETPVGVCVPVSLHLVASNIATDHVEIFPDTKDNIRGVSGINGGTHYIAGTQLHDGRYVYIDGAWPRYGTHAREQGLPYGTFMIAENKQEADKIVKLVYGGHPRESVFSRLKRERS